MYFVTASRHKYVKINKKKKKKSCIAEERPTSAMVHAVLIRPCLNV